MKAVIRRVAAATLCLQAFHITLLEAAKQHVPLSDSYLPVAMQVIAHLTDQMAFENKEESGAKPPIPTTTKKPSTTTARPLYVTSDYFGSLKPRSVEWWRLYGISRDVTTPFHRPGYYAPSAPPKPSERVTSQKQQHYNFPSHFQQQYNFPSQNQQSYNLQSQTQQQYVSQVQNQQQYNVPQQNQQQYNVPLQNQQQYNVQLQNQQQYNVPQQNQDFNISQNYHQNMYTQQYSPFPQNQQYSAQQNQRYGVMTFDFPQYNPIQPQDNRNEEPLLSAHQDEVKPLLDPTPEAPPLLPPHFETDVDKISSRSKGFEVDELTEENLQYLSHDVREMIRMAHDPNDDRLVDVWEGLRAHPAEPSPKGKLSSSNLRLLLLYDLLSREAKRQKLSDYSGFSPDVMKTLVDSSSGGARAQLSLALAKMVDRQDCAHEYANNRAKEMVAELAKDESKLSSEIRYLEPLVYKY